MFVCYTFLIAWSKTVDSTTSHDVWGGLLLYSRRKPAPDTYWCLIRGTKNMHKCNLIEKGKTGTKPCKPANPLQKSQGNWAKDLLTNLSTTLFFSLPPKNVCSAFVIGVFPSFVTSVTSPPASWHHPSGEPVLIYNTERRPRWPALYTCCCHHLIGTGGMFFFFFFLYFLFF